MSPAIDRPHEPQRTPATGFLQSFLGTLFAVAVAALAMWPHLRSLFD